MHSIGSSNLTRWMWKVSHGNAIAALMPDSVPPERVASALGLDTVAVSPALPRDDGSVWVLSLRPIRVGSPCTLRLIDASAFGTWTPPHYSALSGGDYRRSRPRLIGPMPCSTWEPGSGVLALGALRLGVPRVLGIDIDEEALRVAAENARLNELGDRLWLARGGPEAVAGSWPLVVANILAAPLVEMAPDLVRRVGHHGHLVLSWNSFICRAGR